MSVITKFVDEIIIPEVPPPTEEQRKRIKATAPILAEHGLTITLHFYEQMLQHHPDLRNLFNHTAQKTGQQPIALANTLHAYAANIDDLTPILPVIDRICQKHVSLHLLPSQYGIVGAHLLQAIKEVLGDNFTSDLFSAWYSAYWHLARICIAREEELYCQAAWISWKLFKVEKRLKESDDITSFYLIPEDESILPLPSYKPGQFTSVRKFIPGLGLYQARQYSLSDASDDRHFRISVRRDRRNPSLATPDSTPGWMSNFLHDSLQEGDTVEVAAPFGDFFLDLKSSSPVVLLSAGVGLTPVLSMLNTIFGKNSVDACSRQVSWIHTTRNRASHAFKEHIHGINKEYPGTFRSIVFYSRPDGNAVIGEDYDFEGRLDLAKVSQVDLHVQDKSAQYYICGPIGFMSDVSKALLALNVEANRIHMEVFGVGSLPNATST